MVIGSGKTDPLPSRLGHQEKTIFLRRSQESIELVVYSSMVGPCGWSLTFRCETQARAPPNGRPARGVRVL